MRAARSGQVINLSSVGGFQSAPGHGVYCSTKFAVEALSEALHGELTPLGVKVTVVEPVKLACGKLRSYRVLQRPGICDRRSQKLARRSICA
jgi:short-subunit dehydrogenase